MLFECECMDSPSFRCISEAGFLDHTIILIFEDLHIAFYSGHAVFPSLPDTQELQPLPHQHVPPAAAEGITITSAHKWATCHPMTVLVCVSLRIRQVRSVSGSFSDNSKLTLKLT